MQSKNHKNFVFIHQSVTSARKLLFNGPKKCLKFETLFWKIWKRTQSQFWQNVRLMSLVSEEKFFFGITVVPHTFPVPLLVKHNGNLKCEITEHWFVFLYSKCDFWTSHSKKLTCTKFQLDRSLRPEVIKRSINSKWCILVPIRYFAQIFK